MMAQKTNMRLHRRGREHDRRRGLRLRRRRAARGARSACRCSAACRSTRGCARRRRRRAARLGRTRVRGGRRRSSRSPRRARRRARAAAADPSRAARPRQLTRGAGRAPPRARLLRGGRAGARGALRRRRAPRQAEPRALADRLARVAARPRSRGPAAAACSRSPGYERWDGSGAVGYLTLAAICDAQLADAARAGAGRRRVPLLPDRRARLLGAPAGRGRARRGADRDLACAARLTRKAARRSPGRTRSRSAIPSSDGQTARRGRLDGRGHARRRARRRRRRRRSSSRSAAISAHKAFALAVGLQLLVEALAGDEPGAVLVVARPEATRCRRYARSPPASVCPATR